MWTIFNPTDNDLQYEYKYLQYGLKAGETKKFPDDVGEYIYGLHGFLQVLKKDEEKPKKEHQPPKKLSDIEEADAVPVYRDRRVKHPTSDEDTMSRSNFLPTEQAEGLKESSVGLKFREKIQGGKLVQIDGDGVEWYGEGAKQDNPFSIDND